jgi:hypothetical protein
LTLNSFVDLTIVEEEKEIQKLESILIVLESIQKAYDLIKENSNQNLEVRGDPRKRGTFGNR